MNPSNPPKPRRRWYTVILLYPDYCSDCYGDDTYIEHVLAVNVPDAVTKARSKAMKFNTDADGDCFVNDPSDFLALVVCRGRQRMYSPDYDDSTE